MQLKSLAVTLATASLALAESAFYPARPPAVPLAVKSPYLSTWQHGGGDDGIGGQLAGRWQQHWAGGINGMAGIIRVDGKAYEFMGAPAEHIDGLDQVTQASLNYTATRSIFAQSAGPIQIKTTFLSPVFPDDMQRASVISSYVDVELSSTDGNEHEVQLYTDVSAEWASGDPSAVIQWDYGIADHTVYHKFERQTQLLFSETYDKAEWGSWYWAGERTAGQTWMSGVHTDVRGQFVQDGKLSNSQDTRFRAATDAYPVFGLAYDLGQVGSAPANKLFTIGLYQHDAVQFTGAAGTLPLPSLWVSYFDDELQALEWFFRDYNTASTECDALDAKILDDSLKAGGDDYPTITMLATRQAFAGVELAGNATKPYLFLKEISSDGNVNTADVMYPSMPIFLYTNATYLKLMLDPVFENQESGHYPKLYAMHDLGGSFPNATGHPDGNDEYMPLEECGNMLVMTAAYYQKSKDLSFLIQHYDILKQWTDFLVEFDLNQVSQLTTDDFAGALTNSTNLAYKGVIGIGAMANIAKLTGHSDDAANLSSIATSYIDALNTLAFDDPANPTKALLEFGNQSSWLTLYNLYADKLLGLDLVPQKVFDVQNRYYATRLQEYGLPLDSRSPAAKGDWEMFAAAVGDDTIRHALIRRLAKWIGENPLSVPLGDLYTATARGDWPPDVPRFIARPVVGGMFALLALDG